MSLLNAALAFGAFAFAIPLIIHLFFRSRYKTIDWGAMYLLESVIRINRRRMQLTNWLLLLLRCAIPVLLAFCLARPVWTGLRALAGDAPKTLVIAIDDSRSMSVTPPGEPSRIEAAKQEIRTVLDDLTRRDEVIFVRSSRLGAVPAKMGVSDALATLRKMDAKGDSVSIGQLIDAANAAAEEGSHPRRQVLLVSDFQASAVDTATLELARRITAANTLAENGGSGNKLVVDILDVGNQWDELANVSVDAVTVDSPVIVSQRAGVYSATLRNSSELPANDLRLVWSIDGKPLEPRVVSVDAKSTATNRLTHTIDQPGMHEVAVTIDRGDALVDDNRRSVAVEVTEEINVLLVDGRPSGEPLRGQADFLAIALSPFAFGGDDRPDPVRAAVVTANQVETALAENELRVVILCGVGQLPDAATKRITDFVNQGGALVTFDGPDVRPEFYNTVWRNGDHQLRFPASLGDTIGNPEVQPAGADELFTIDKPASLYAPWRILSSGDENPLSDVNLSAYRTLKIADDTDTQASAVNGDGTANGGGTGNGSTANGGTGNGSGNDSDSAASDRYVLLRSGDGDPLAVIGSVGEGTVVQFAISGNDDWTNLPLRPVFLPLVQQLVLDLAGKRSDAMIRVGQPIVIGANDWPKPKSEIQGEVRETFTARTPRGEFEIDAPIDDNAIRLTATYEPGVYRLQKRITDARQPEKSVVTETMRIASVDPSESMLVDVTQQRLSGLAEILGAQVFESGAVLQQADRSRSFGREIWRWLLVLLLIALVSELWLQQNLIKRRPPAGASP